MSLQSECFVIVRPDGLWYGPFATEEIANDFYNWKKRRGGIIEGKHLVKKTTVARILERIEERQKNGREKT